VRAAVDWSAGVLKCKNRAVSAENSCTARYLPRKHRKNMFYQADYVAKVGDARGVIAGLYRARGWWPDDLFGRRMNGKNHPPEKNPVLPGRSGVLGQNVAAFW
jgi:hypothetical protein